MFSELKAAMHAAGIDPTSAPLIADGKLRRFRLPGDRAQSKNGYITLFDNHDGSHGAAFGSWKHGIRETWFSGKSRRELSAAERRECAKCMAEARAKQEAEQRRRHEAAAKKARHLWEQATPAAVDHPYLTRKQVRPHGLRQLDQSLVVPVRECSGELTGLQFIDLNGGKRFLSGTRLAGCYCAIGSTPFDTLLLAEGYATAATLHEATGHPTACGFNAGNLEPVAVVLRVKYPPPVRLIICADADPAGRKAAAAAAEAVNGTWIEPDFSEKASTAHA